MEIMDIIKEAFIFPSQNIEKLAIYIALTFVIAILKPSKYGITLSFVIGVICVSFIFI